MHVSSLFLQNMLCEMWKTSTIFSVEVFFAPMICAPLPRALGPDLKSNCTQFEISYRVASFLHDKALLDQTLVD